VHGRVTGRAGLPYQPVIPGILLVSYSLGHVGNSHTALQCQVEDVNVEFYLPQLLNLLLFGVSSKANLERFLLKKCAESMHLAFQFYWLLTSYMEDDPHNPYIQSLRAACEMAVVNEGTGVVGGVGDDAAREAELKVMRAEFFVSVIALVDRLVRVSSSLRSVAVGDRHKVLQDRLLAAWSALGSARAYIPLWPANHRAFSVVRLPPNEALILSSRDRVPYMMFFEVVWSSEGSVSSSLAHNAAVIADIGRLMGEVGAGDNQAVQVSSGSEIDASSIANAPTTSESIVTNAAPDTNQGSTQATMSAKAVESVPLSSPWQAETEERRLRVAKESPCSGDANWDLLSVIVKYGDDCRQERLAVQVLTQMKRIFDNAAIPVYLHPHAILIVGSRAALIETIRHVKSIDQCKRVHPHIMNWFKERFGDPLGAAYQVAQRNFVESLAGYSIACYLLAIKDRHNGNILLDTHGHLIHIDFGYILGLSPGSVQFESAPFKLVPEWIQLMGGEEGDLFHYFKALLVKGFIELQKHSDSIFNLIEVMTCKSEGKQPIQCLRGGAAASLDALQRRFDALGKAEPDVVKSVNRLVSQAMNSSSTKWYDQFQWLQNRILFKTE
jgi:hypothetical protein